MEPRSARHVWEHDMPTILLTGDVMLGRGIDQVLGQPSSPEIHEPFCRSALDYVALAERKNGPIPRTVGCDYIWGDALGDMLTADLRIINLETAVTCCNIPAQKSINYRCHPANLDCLVVARVDCCALANNHVLDWGEIGLIETLDALDARGLRHSGAGRDLDEAERPAVLPLQKSGRILIYALGSPSSGVPRSWAAQPTRAGINLLDEHDPALQRLSARIAADKRVGDIAIVSIHWGGNWGYEIPDAQRSFAHALIDKAGADLVHTHSSHHAKAIEFYRERSIFYGCGDFLNDYEGIGGKEKFRPELVLAYEVELVTDGRCSELRLVPFRIANFRLNRASAAEAEWLCITMDRECRPFGGRVERKDDRLHLHA